MSRWLWILNRISSRLWLTATLYGVAAVGTAMAAWLFSDMIPEDYSRKIGASAVDSILNIMAASMLSVTIFSLSTIVSAYSAATNNVTPRATKLLLEDKISHRALSTFIGAFIFSIVGMTALKAGIYGDSGRLILFLVTIGVIVMIVVTLLRWIEYLTRLGRVHETIDRVEDVTAKALKERLCTPCLGGIPLDNTADIPDKAHALLAGCVGYVQHIDMGLLSSLADEYALHIYVQALPGKFVDSHMAVAYVTGTTDEDILAHLLKAFIIESDRSFDQDPRYGVAVLCEIGMRALSPAINDPGTAIYVIGVMVRILSVWSKRAELADPKKDVHYPRIYVPALNVDDIFDDFFPSIARDGSAYVEVQIRLQKAYAALARAGDADLKRAATFHAEQSAQRAFAALDHTEDLKRLKAALFKG